MRSYVVAAFVFALLSGSAPALAAPATEQVPPSGLGQKAPIPQGAKNYPRQDPCDPTSALLGLCITSAEQTATGPTSAVSTTTITATSTSTETTTTSSTTSMGLPSLGMAKRQDGTTADGAGLNVNVDYSNEESSSSVAQTDTTTTMTPTATSTSTSVEPTTTSDEGISVVVVLPNADDDVITTTTTTVVIAAPAKRQDAPANDGANASAAVSIGGSPLTVTKTETITTTTTTSVDPTTYPAENNNVRLVEIDFLNSNHAKRQDDSATDSAGVTVNAHLGGSSPSTVTDAPTSRVTTTTINDASATTKTETITKAFPTQDAVLIGL